MSSLQVPHAFIFDLDGVIIDSEPLHEQALREACSEYDTSLSERILDEFRGQPDRAIVGHLIQETNASSSVEHILAAKREIYGELVDQLTLIPGVLNFIQTLNNRDFPMAVVTSSSRSDQERTFKKFELAPYFSTILTAEDVTQTKPHPEPYRGAVQRLGVAPSTSLVIEDSVPGVKSARRAGCSVVGICTSCSADALWDAGAHQVVEKYAELREHLDGLLPKDRN